MRFIGSASPGVILWAAIAAGATSVAAAEAPVRLADVVAEARARNPEIAAARARADAAAARPPQARAWEDPVVTWEAWNAPESFDVARADNNIVRVGQKLPFPGKLTLMGRMAARDADMAARDADAVALDVVTAVKHAYWDLWRRRRTVAIVERDRDLVDRYARIALEKYTVGEAAQSDVLRAQVELAHQVNRLTTETLGADGARAELNALLSRPPDAPLGPLEEPPAPRVPPRTDGLIARALAARPELVGQAAVIARAREAVRLARLEYLPDFELSVGRFINVRGRDGVGAMASVTVPLPNKAKYDAGRAEAAAALAAAEAELRRLQDRVRREVEQAYLRAQAARTEHDLFATTHVPHAEQALRASETGYRTGKVDFLSLVDSVRAVQMVHLEHVRASADFETAWADLERAVGAELARDGGE